MAPTGYYTLLIALPLVLAGIIPFIKPSSDGGRNLHLFGIGGAALLFLASMIAWNAPTLPAAESWAWLPSVGIRFALGADGLSMTMVTLTTLLLALASVASLSSIRQRLKLYYALLFILTSALLGVFLARDLFCFFLFYELELIPMALLIAIWGGPRRGYAATKFALYTLFGSIFLVAAILGLYVHGRALGLNPESLLMFDSVKASIPFLASGGQLLIFAAFFLAFAVKLPVVPLHTWLPDAHVEAPTPVSMLLAGILLKMGAYGMLRCGWEFLPQAAHALSPWIALLAVINIVYAAAVAMAQTDLKKLVAYSSVSHMGFVLLGLAAMNPAGFNGAVFVMFAHGLVSAALFMCVGTVYERTHTRQIAELGGLGRSVPTLFYYFMVMAMASLGLPLLISFASETLVFYGGFLSRAFMADVRLWPGVVIPWSMQVATALAAIGVILGAAYMLWMLQRVFFGPVKERWAGLSDASLSETFVLGALSAFVLLYGVFPQWLTRHFEPDVTAMAQRFAFIPTRREALNLSAAPAPTPMHVLPPALAPAQESRTP